MRPLLFRSSSPTLLEESSVTLFATPAPLVVLPSNQVQDGASSLNQTVDENLQALEVQYAHLDDYLLILQKMQGQLEELVSQVADIPFWDKDGISLEELASKIELYDWYR